METRRLAWPLRKDDTHKSRKYETFFFSMRWGRLHKKRSRHGRGMERGGRRGPCARMTRTNRESMKPFCFFITGPAWGITTRGGHTGHEITTPFFIKSNGERGRLAWPLRKDDTHKSRKYETFFFLCTGAGNTIKRSRHGAWNGEGAQAIKREGRYAGSLGLGLKKRV